MSEHRVIVADPPWRHADGLPKSGPDRHGRSASAKYSTMSVGEVISDQPQPSMVAPNAVLFLWRVASMVEEAYAVIRGWGFTPKAEIVWVKTKIATGIVQDEHDLSFGMGRYVRAAHETCVVATRGKPSLCRPQTMSVRSVFYAPRGAHSAKPEAFYRLVERMYEGPYLELYGRRLRDGWTVLGEEVAHLSEVGS